MKKNILFIAVAFKILSVYSCTNNRGSTAETVVTARTFTCSECRGSFEGMGYWIQGGEDLKMIQYEKNPNGLDEKCFECANKVFDKLTEARKHVGYGN